MALRFGDNPSNETISSGIRFDTGHVIRVYTDPNDIDFAGLNISNIKKGSQLVQFVTANNNSNLTETKSKLIAQPLLRGISDSMAPGDLILFTELGGVNFYMGPINTSNKPHYSLNHLKNHSNYINHNIPNKPTVHKLSKRRKPKLDFPYGQIPVGEINPNSIEYINSQFSDLTLEGRYGNSIRLGARNVNPNIIISNNQSKRNYGQESLFNVGSSIAMLSLGRPNDVLNIPDVEPYNNYGWLSYDIMLYNDASPFIHLDYRPYKIDFDYYYGEIEVDAQGNQGVGDQIIIRSNKIIFDTTRDNMTLSSARTIQIGARNFTVNTFADTIFESRNIYIGKKARDRSQPMVLGEELRRLLTRILRLIADAQALGDYNVPQPLTVFPNVLQAGSLKTEVDNIMKEFNLGSLVPGQNPPSPDPGYDPYLREDKPVGDRAYGNATFMSQHHFIETNRE